MKQIKLGEFHYQKVLEMLIEATYLLVFLTVPLAMAWFLPTDNVFELNKVVLFRSLIYILFSLTLAKALFFSSKQKFSLRYLWPVLALVIFGAMALFFSVDPTQSYYGLNDRQQGYRSLLFYAWWFVLLFYNLATASDLQKKINRIFWVIMGSSFLVSLYAILQILGIDFIAWTEPAFMTHRATSTLGQPNYLGSYLLLIIPLTIYGLTKYRQFWWRFILGFLLLLQLIALVVTGSRAAWLGLLGALALLAFWSLSRLLVNLSGAKKRGVLVISIISLILLGALLSQNNYIATRLKGMTDFKQGSVSARVNFWSAAWQSFLQKPLLGYGLENQGTEFIKYYKVDWAQTGFVNASTNRAHNLILDILLTTGIIGLIFYVWVYTSFFRWAKQNRGDKEYRLWSEFLIGSVVAYLISLLFGFSVIVTEVYFWSYLALAVAVNARLRDSGEGDYRIKLNQWIKLIIIILVIFFSVRQITVEFKSLAADNYFLEIRKVLLQNDYPKALFYYQDIKTQNVPSFHYTYAFVEALPYDLEQDVSPVILNLFQTELNNILPQLSRDNYDDTYLRAKIYTLLKNYPLAEEAYQKIINISPELPKNYFVRAKFYVLGGRDDLALLDLQKVLNLLPAPQNYPEALSSSENSVAYYRSLVLKEMGDIYFRQGKYDLAGVNYRAAYLLNLSDVATYKKIADTYFMRGDLKTALWYNLRGTERHSSDYVWFYSAAIIYEHQGDYLNAVKYLNLAVDLDTSKKIPTEIIDSIRQKAK